MQQEDKEFYFYNIFCKFKFNIFINEDEDHETEEEKLDK